MYIITNKFGLIVYITNIAEKRSDGIYIGDNTILINKEINVYNVEDVPSNIVPYKYYYNKEDGFYNNIKEEKEEIIIPDNLSIDELKQYMVDLTNKQCKEVLNNGITINTEFGEEKFALTIEDQTNISQLRRLIDSGLTELPYHSTNNITKIYTAEDILKISIESDVFILKNTIHCNLINNWIRRSTNRNIIKKIDFHSILPKDLKSNYDNMIDKISKDIYKNTI